MAACIFCKIISNKLPGKIIYESNQTMGIFPKESVSKGHTLLIPKKHFENIFDIDKEVLKELIISTKKLSIIIVDKFNATGINILHASGKDAQQSVFHFHIHIIPRYPNDGLDLWIKNKL